MTIQFTDANFESEVLKSDIPVLVDFWAPWCGPCQMMGPVIDSLAQKYEGRIKIGKSNVDENPETAQKYSIMSIPALKIFKAGEVVKDLVGARSEEMLAQELDSII